MSKLMQGLLYIAFAVVIGYFSVSPDYQYSDPQLATIKLSLSHATNRVEECVKLTPQEISERAVSGQKLSQCGRERLPLAIELEVDGTVVYQGMASPSGVWRDGTASVYQRLTIAPGTHVITARLRDSSREDGWDYTHTEEAVLAPGRYFTITFRAGTGGFSFR